MTDQRAGRTRLHAIAPGTACSFVMAPPISAGVLTPRTPLEQGDVVGAETVTNIRSLDVDVAGH